MKPVAGSVVSRRAAFVVSAAALVLAAALPAHAGDLAAYLERAEKMTTVNEKVEADITIKDGAGTTTKAHLVLDPANGGTAIYEEPETGWRSETPLDWKDGKAVTKTGAAPVKIGIDDPLGSGDLRGIDFFPFWKTDYGRALTSDENTLQRTVTLYADKGRPYALYVVTFDKAKLVPHMLKFYRDTFNNLVRIRTDKDWVMVGSRPRPTGMLIQDYTNHTNRVYTFDWKLAGAAPAGGAPAQAAPAEGAPAQAAPAESAH
jgi:hypothetical protein